MSRLKCSKVVIIDDSQYPKYTPFTCQYFCPELFVFVSRVLHIFKCDSVYFFIMDAPLNTLVDEAKHDYRYTARPLKEETYQKFYQYGLGREVIKIILIKFYSEQNRLFLHHDGL